MADAKPGVHVVQLQPICVPEPLIKGNKFIMFTDSSTIGTPVTLKVDAQGYILYWKDQNKEMDFLDISLIKDTRTGKETKIPKDHKLKESLMIGQMDVPLEDKLVSVVYGTDMVNIEMVHFVCAHQETAQEWAECLLSYSINLLALNGSALTYLEKLFIKFSLVLNSEAKVSMKNIIKHIASNREDRKKVEKALDSMGFHPGKTDSINPQKFSFDNFFNFYVRLTGRSEVSKIFEDLGAKKKPYLTVQQFCDFLNKQQRDPRLNEILYPFLSLAQADALIHKYENKTGMAQKGHLSLEGFLRFLMSDDNNLIPADKLDLSEDMDQPIAHYFINSSHNTYLTGHQFTSKSAVEVYHQVLLSGCRCIELDCWDGRDSDTEPVITHGYTMCTEILFKDVIEAIAQSAFKTSEYPVILSFENHCSPKQQAKMANYCRTIFGDMLLINPLETNPLKQDIPLPSPNMLKRKIIVKNKKKHFHREKSSRKNRAQNMSKRLRKNQEGSIKSKLTGVEEDVEMEASATNAEAAPSSTATSTSPAPASPGEQQQPAIPEGNDESTKPVPPGSPSSPTTPTSPTSPPSPPSSPSSPVSPTPPTSPEQEPLIAAAAADTPEPPATPATAELKEPKETKELKEQKSPTRIALEKNLSICSEGTDTSEMSREGDFGFDSDSDSSESDDEDETTTEEEKERVKKKQKKILTEEEKKRRQKMKKDKGTAGKEASAGMEMSLLVNYIQPVHFHTFEQSEKRKRSYEITSFVETQGTSLLKESPVDFVNYNKRQMSRIYPKGTRVDSSNFMPQVFWNAGCQLVALNFQTLDLAMQINQGIFEFNNRSGYILKPDFMRRPDRHFDPFAESTVDGIIAGTVTVRIISAQFLTDKKVGTYVEVDMYGLPTDTVRKKFRTKVVPNNGMNPVYNENPFVFKKVVLPNLATVRIAVYEDQNKSQLGHRVLPVEGLRPGYRHIPLRNECNQPLLTPTLFVHITVKDYVPDSLAEYADALYNPIAYQSSLEKHSQQLEILTEDFEAEPEETPDLSGVPLKSSASQMQMDVSATSADFNAAASGNKRQNSTSSRTLGASGGGAGVGGGVGGNGNAMPTSESLNALQQKQATYVRSSSMSHMAVSKQESSNSATSQGSGAPGQMYGMQSGILGQENGTTGSFIQQTKLSDTSILTPTPLSELKTCKAYVKAVAKRDKELESLRRKHEKEREVTEELQQIAEDKLISSQTKTRISMEKMHSKILKKKAKGGDNIEIVQGQLKWELQDLLSIQDLAHREMKSSHAKTIMTMCRKNFEAEMDVQIRHHEQIYDCLEKLMETTHSAHTKALDEIHDREVVELKKLMDAQSRNQMKALGKKHKDRQELSRLKREAQQKHVNTAVTERQKLKDLLEKRQGDLQGRLDEIRKEFRTERESALSQIKDNHEKNMQQLMEELGSQMLDDYDNEEEMNGGGSEPQPLQNGNNNEHEEPGRTKGLVNGDADDAGPHVTTLSVGSQLANENGLSPSSASEGESSPEHNPNKINSDEHLTTM